MKIGLTIGAIAFWLFSLAAGLSLVSIQLYYINPNNIAQTLFYICVVSGGVSFAVYCILFWAAAWRKTLSFSRLLAGLVLCASLLSWVAVIPITDIVKFGFNNQLSYQTILALYFLAGCIALLLKKISRYYEPPEKEFDSFV